MDTQGHVVVMGSANVDLVVPVPRHPAGGETILGGNLERHPGGKGANQAVAAARAGGARTTFLGALGRDEAGDLLAESLAGAGVEVDLVDRVAAPTGTALISVTPDGENTIIVAPGANGHLRVGAAQAERLASADVVLAQLEVPLDVVEHAARARAEGAVFVLNAAPSHELPDGLWDAIDVLVVNEHEAADLAGPAGSGSDGAAAAAAAPRAAGSQGAASGAAGHPDDAGGQGPRAGADHARALAAALLQRVPAVVITLGEEGALVATRGGEPAIVPAFAVDVVDTIGAGDTFCGVLAAQLARGTGLVEAARSAGAAGALATTAAGAQEAVPTAEDVARLTASAPDASH